MILARLEGMLITHRIDLLYFAGTAQNAYLYVHCHEPPLLLVRRHLPRAVRDSAIERIEGISSVKEIPSRIARACGALPRALGLAWDAVPAREFRFLRELLPAALHADGSRLIHGIRAVKSDWETRRMERAASLGSMMLDHLGAQISPGMPAAQIEGLAEAFARSRGHGGGIRVRQSCHDPHSVRIGTGGSRREAVPASDKCFPLVFRAVVGGYHAEEGRPHCRPRMDDRQRELSARLEAVEERVCSRALPGVTLRDLALRAYEELCSSRGGVQPETPVFNCRGIGLELWEPPFAALQPRAVLEQGMCLVLEIGLLDQDGEPVTRSGTFTAAASGLLPLSRGPLIPGGISS